MTDQEYCDGIGTAIDALKNVVGELRQAAYDLEKLAEYKISAYGSKDMAGHMNLAIARLAGLPMRFGFAQLATIQQQLAALESRAEKEGVENP